MSESKNGLPPFGGRHAGEAARGAVAGKVIRISSLSVEGGERGPALETCADERATGTGLTIGAVSECTDIFPLSKWERGAGVGPKVEEGLVEREKEGPLALSVSIG